MSLLIFLIHLILLICAINFLKYFRQSGLSAFELNLFFLLKLFFGFLLIYVYARFYPQRNLSDVFKYFDDANVIYNNAQIHHLNLWHLVSGIGFDRHTEQSAVLLSNTHHFDKKGGGFLEANHLVLIRLNLILCFMSQGNIFIHSLWFSFLSFTGFVGVFYFLKRWFTENIWAFKGILFIIPSVLFWSSGLLKEALLFFSIGLTLYAFSRLYFLNIWAYFLLFLIALSVGWILKPFVCIALIVSLLFFVLYRYSKLYFTATLIVFIILFFFQANTLSEKIFNKRLEFIEVGKQVKSGSLMDTQIYADKSFAHLLAITPRSMYNVLFEPIGFSYFDAMNFPFVVEHFLLILMLVLLIRYADFRLVDKSILVFLFIFSIFQLLIIGWSVPIIGAFLRYKVTAMPFLFSIILLFFNLNKFKYDIKTLFGIKKVNELS